MKVFIFLLKIPLQQVTTGQNEEKNCFGGYAAKTDAFTTQSATKAHRTLQNKGQKDARVRMPSRRLAFFVYSGEATLVKKNASWRCVITAMQ